MLRLIEAITATPGTALVDNYGNTWYVISNLTKHVVIRNEFMVKRLDKSKFPLHNFSLKGVRQ